MPAPRPLSPQPAVDLARTLALWAYFTFGYLALFLPAYIAARWLAEDREAAFQRLNHLFFRLFFRVLAWVVPGARFRIGPGVRAIRGAVIVCNHRSYLDPLLLISLFEKQKTIVKALFFDIPIFRWALRHSGYIPAAARGALASRTLEQVQSLGPFLAAGGNLFVFPEGTRGMRRGAGKLEKGAFRLARRWSAPIEVLWVENTDKLFPPGRFRFDTRRPPEIRVTHLGRIAPGGEPARVSDQVVWVRSLFAGRAGRGPFSVDPPRAGP